MDQNLEQPKKAFNRRRVLLIVLSSVLLLLALSAAGVISYVYFIVHPFDGYDKILPNVYCAGVDLSGMTRQEAKEAVEEALRHPSYHVKVILPDGEYLFQPEQEGITLNAESVAQKAYAYGRADGSAFGLYRAYQRAKGTEYRLNPETALNYSREDILVQSEEISRDTYLAPTASAANWDDSAHQVTVTPGQPGHLIPAETIYRAVCAAFDDLELSDIHLDYTPVEIDMEELKQICRETARDSYTAPANPAVTADKDAHAIRLTKGTLGWSIPEETLYRAAETSVSEKSYEAVTLDMESIRPPDPGLDEACELLSCDPTEPYYYGGSIYEGSDGYYLDWETAALLIEEADWGAEVTIPMTPVSPVHTAEEFRSVLFRDRLSSYSTAHTANSDRTNNLRLACEAINGTVVNAGEIFSFNGTVGQRTAAKGYRSATVYVGTESQEQLGGGICQVASTIYDAALYAEMEITSRDCHTFLVTYVPGGLDATVYWDGLDFSFRNSTEYPIRVNASVSGGYVNISIDGTKTNDHVVELSSTQISSTPYSTVYRHDSSKPAGYQSVTTSPYTGYSYDAYQYIYDGSGRLIETNYLGRSYYEKRDQVITIGTG